MSEQVFDLELDAYLKDVEDMFHGLEREKYNMERKAIAAGSRYIAKEVRRDYNAFFPGKPNQHPNKPSNWKNEPKNLRSSIKAKQYRKPKLGAYITSTVHAYNEFSPNQPHVLYGIALGAGYTLKPKDPDGWLKFPTPDGKWHTVKEVEVTKRPWISTPAERAAKSNQVYLVMDSTINQEIQKLAKNPNYRVVSDLFK